MLWGYDLYCMSMCYIAIYVCILVHCQVESERLSYCSFYHSSLYLALSLSPTYYSANCSR